MANATSRPGAGEAGTAARRDLLIRVAKLYYYEGLSQGEIAGKIGVSRSNVSKMLQACKDRQIVEIRIDETSSTGLYLESELARRLGVCSPRDARRIRNLLVRLGLPTRPPSRWSRSAFRSSLALDKKATHVAPRWVLPSGVGRCVIGVEVEPTLIRDVMKGTR